MKYIKESWKIINPTSLIAALLSFGSPAPGGAAGPYSALIDIQFAQTISGLKVGLAATGLTTNDFWNFYNRDDGHGGWRVNGALPNLKFADGSASSVGLLVTNAPGCWYNGSSDAMYGTYLYPLGAGDITLIVTNLPAGENDFYIYGYQGNYHLTVGSTDYGTRTCYEPPEIRSNPPPWEEGRQFTLFRGVSVGVGQAVKIIVGPGQGEGTRVISGIQIASISPCTPHPATATATVVNGFVVGATITDGGCGYTNTPWVLIQGGGGTGATGTAVVNNGVVTNVTITSTGNGYTSTPNVFFYWPTAIQAGLIKAVKPAFTNLITGVSYQLQVSADMKTWTNSGSPFTAASSSIVYPQYWDVDNWNQLFFRLQVAP